MRAFGQPPTSISTVAADGSQRSYYRLSGGPHGSAIGGYGPDAEENRAFLSFTRTFSGIGLPVPRLYAEDEERGLWLSQDLGDSTLFDTLTAARATDPDAEFPASMVPVYGRVVEQLPRFQVEGGRVVDYDVAYPRAAFDQQSMRWDLNYFKYHFLKLAHIPFSEQRLENDFDVLTDLLLSADSSHFLYRDFQSRNVMLLEGRPWFIDYQGGRRGAPHYDIASLLYDAKAALTDEVRERLLDRYLAALSGYTSVDRDRFIDEYRGFVLIRIMQAMGAYGYRGFFERKARFLQSVPYAARNIAKLLETGLPVRLPEVEAVFGRIADAWADAPGRIRPLEGLTVHLTSFSYRKGYPDDTSGHGGGFVFDCRSLPNPGRHPEYADVTGLDPGVIAYLEEQPEVDAFWQSARALIDTHIDSFLARGFSNLAVSFGCTGGQHRSVFFAERVRDHIRETRPDVAVRLVHRERKSWPQPATPESVPAPDRER